MRFKSLSMTVTAGIGIVGATFLGVPACDNLRTETPLLVQVLGLDQDNIVDGYYVVVLKEDVELSVLERMKVNIESLGGRVEHVYEHAFRGLAAYMDTNVLKTVQRDDRVEYIEVVHQMVPTGMQSCAPWNLSYLSHWEEDPFQADAAYVYGGTGKDTRVYVIDRGIQGSHNEFKNAAGASRVAMGLWYGNMQWHDNDPMDDTIRWDRDKNGHGTAMGSIAVGRRNGVAKEAQLFSLRIDSDEKCKWATSALIAEGLDRIAQLQTAKSPLAVVLLGHAKSGAVQNICTAIEKIERTIFIVPAGNDGAEITTNPMSTSTPAYCRANANALKPSSAMIVVGAHGKPILGEDIMLESSNYGPIVDLFAPGDSIIVASPEGGVCAQSDIGSVMNDLPTPPVGMDSDGKYAVINGTSPAAAHVAGLAAILIEQNPMDSASAIKQKLLDAATNRVLKRTGPGNGEWPVLRIPYESEYSGHKSNAIDIDACNDISATTSSSEDSRICAFDPEDVTQFASGKPSCFDGTPCNNNEEICKREGIACVGGKCQRCGGKDHPCCAKDACLTGLMCYEGVCSCGGENEICCAGGQCDTIEDGDVLVCNGGAGCVRCGYLAKPCCKGSNASEKVCFENLACDLTTGTCGSCGAVSQPCCNGDVCPAANAKCDSGKCVDCGTKDKPCCDVSEEPECESSYTCYNGTCGSCGHLGQACCGDTLCVEGSCIADANGAKKCQSVKEIDLMVDFFPLQMHVDEEFNGQGCGPYVEVSIKVETVQNNMSYPQGGILITSLNKPADPNNPADPSKDVDCACLNQPVPCASDPMDLATGPHPQKCGSLVTMIELDKDCNVLGNNPFKIGGNRSIGTYSDRFFAIPNKGLVGDPDTKGYYTFKAYYQDKTQADWDDVLALSVASPPKATISNPSSAVVSLNCVGDTDDNDICSDYAPPSTECSACSIWLKLSILE